MICCTRDIDLGAIVGLGAAVTLPWHAVIALEVQYRHGLISNFESDDIEADYKNRALLFSIGYSHRLGETEPR